MRLSGYGGEAPRGPDAASGMGKEKRGIGEVHMDPKVKVVFSKK